MEHYFTGQRDNIFRNVEVLIYVFDVESREIDKDIHHYQFYIFKILYIDLMVHLQDFMEIDKVYQNIV